MSASNSSILYGDYGQHGTTPFPDVQRVHQLCADLSSRLTILEASLRKPAANANDKADERLWYIINFKIRESFQGLFEKHDHPIQDEARLDVLREKANGAGRLHVFALDAIGYIGSDNPSGKRYRTSYTLNAASLDQFEQAIRTLSVVTEAEREHAVETLRSLNRKTQSSS